MGLMNNKTEYFTLVLLLVHMGAPAKEVQRVRLFHNVLIGCHVCRLLGLTKNWKRLYCTLVPFHFHVGAPATEVQLVMIDETSLSLVDRLWVTNARGVTCPTRARLHIDLVRCIT